MKSHLTDEQLAQYAELLNANQLEKVPFEITEHIANCNVCAVEATELSFVLNELNDALNLPKTNTASASNKYLYLAIAASVVLFLSVWQVFRYTEPSSEQFLAKRLYDAENTGIPKTRQVEEEIEEWVTKTPDSNDLLAAYVPDSETEKLIANLQGNQRSESISIISQTTINAKPNKAIVLQWKNAEDAELTIELFDNKGVNLESESVPGNSYTIKQLPPALYYWKLFNEEFDLLWCGKIVVQ